MRVAELNVYPVKSTRAQPRTRAIVEPWGLADDRRWMVVDTGGRFVTARRYAGLLGVTATPVGPGRLRLESPHADAVEVDGTAEGADKLPVEVWKSTVAAVSPSREADAWFSSLLGLDVRLVWLDDPARRPVDPQYGRPDDRVSFADAYPLLLTASASLRQLDQWATEDALERGDADTEPLTMRRFRPSVVVDTEEPFTEDRWRRIRIGAVDFRVVKPCDRCTMTTIDPDTLVRGKEPLRTLAHHRKWDGKVWFGVNVIPDGTGTLAVGDPVAVLA